ncbi:hypothetical protein [Paenibacillus sinopodophylli]|uniref:hypothetical protein n=1 Tax=Paenibacillus sinopodophylli TaxID=1837342 RepID=UPI00110CB739|nr:hypothetical protein [Paenibacillus sinopodophylli]
MADLIDLTGDTYGRLKVIKEVERKGYTRRWLCQCSCNSDPIIVTMPNLRNNHTRSCGCLHSELTSQANMVDLVGRSFGKLKVLRRDPKKRKSQKVFWICECKCGNSCSVEGVKLVDETTKSCGCRRAEVGEELKEHNKKNLYEEDIFVPLLKSKLRSDSTTGVKGVYYHRDKKGNLKYRASIRIKNKTYYLGSHDTMEKAIAARLAGEEKYHAPYIEALKERNNE